MARNDTGIPFLALLGAAALFLAAWLDGRVFGQLAGRDLAALTDGQIAMIAFAMPLLVYGIIGYLSVWLEGRELRPGRREPPAVRWPVVLALVVLTLALVAAAGSFVRLIASGPATAARSSPLEGAVLAAIFLLMAALAVLQKRYLMAREVRLEDVHEEVPW